jgi:tRNA-modifying protein YgfZ
LIAKGFIGSLLSSMKIPPPAMCFRYAPACVLRVSGPDAATFLQGQFTNDLSKLTSGGSAYGLWLDRKGRVIADSQVICSSEGESFSIVSLGSSADVIAKHLGDHIIADEVEIADETANFKAVALIGPGAAAWLATQEVAGLRFPGRRALGENWEWVYPVTGSATVEPALADLGHADAMAIERMRIEASIPAVPADIGPADLPNEGGLDEVAISYSKGCYLGQEVMARVKNLGRVRRRLVRVRGTDSPPTAPAVLWFAGRQEGEIRSLAPEGPGFAGLALVAVGLAHPGQAFSLLPGAPETVIIS